MDNLALNFIKTYNSTFIQKMNSKQIIKKTREQVLEQLGDDYTTEYGGDIWVYTINKTWYRREKTLIIEFDYEGIAINVDKV